MAFSSGKVWEIRDFKSICPDSTRGEFIPPVILKAVWHAEGKDDPFMVCIYDAAGELLENSAQNGRQEKEN